MGILGLIFLTGFAATVCGSVILIQMGGWLPILVAILLLLHYFFTLGATIILEAIDMTRTKKKGGENHEGIRD